MKSPSDQMSSRTSTISDDKLVDSNANDRHNLSKSLIDLGQADPTLSEDLYDDLG
jgi:hypothetical protein